MDGIECKQVRIVSIVAAMLLWIIPIQAVGQPSSNALLVHIDFNQSDFTKNVFSDSSGNGHDADCQRALNLGGLIYDQCPSAAQGPDGSAAAQFVGSLCDMSSDYLAIANASDLQKLKQGTVSVWVRYETSTYRSTKLVDTWGNQIPNTWMLGRDGSTNNVFLANDDSGLIHTLLMFPDQHLYDREVGTWNHLAVTWDGVTIKGYYNGTYFGAASQKGFSYFTIATYLGLGVQNHGDVRNTRDFNCINQYGGDPSKTYVQPNAGFLNGALDDFRLYARALPPTEIAALANMPQKRATRILQVMRSGNDGGDGNVLQVSTSGISCGRYCAESYAPGSTIKLQSVPDADSTFATWEGCTEMACASGSPAKSHCCQLTLDADKAVQAKFISIGKTITFAQAASATMIAPFVVIDSRVGQRSSGSTASTSGKLSYPFTVAEAGEYFVEMSVDAPDGGSNSFYVNVDGDPLLDPPPQDILDQIASDSKKAATPWPQIMTWHVSLTLGSEKRVVTWEEFSATDSPGSQTVRQWHLDPGMHTLIVRGREANTFLSTIRIVKQGNPHAPLPPRQLQLQVSP